MRYVKILGLAAIAATALMAFVDASTASAAVLCSTTTTPCNSVVANGTKIGFESESSTLLTDTTGETLDTCRKSKVTGELTTPATGPVTTLDWEECTFPTTTIEPGKLNVTGPQTGTSNGTVIADAEIKVTFLLPWPFGSCVYAVSAGTSIGTLTEGNPATFDASAVVTRRSGGPACPETARWSGSYTMTEPANTTFAVESN